MDNDKKPKLGSIAIAGLVTTALIAEGFAWFFGLFGFDWVITVPTVYGIVPLWFYFLGYPYSLIDWAFASGATTISFVPGVSLILPGKILGVVLRKIITIKLAGSGSNIFGSLANSKLLKWGARVAKVVQPELAPAITEAQKGIAVAAAVEGARTPRRGPAHGERIPKTGNLVGDAINSKAITKPKVGQEIKPLLNAIPSTI